MQKITEYLKRFSIILNSGHQKKTDFISEIKNQIGIDLPKAAIDIKNNIAYIKCSPITRSSILIKKRSILGALEKRQNHISDIR